jgi:hypothetical protein
MDPDIRSEYVARASLAGLARQYWRYGYWKYRMLRKHPDTIRWRQALPPLFVLGLITLGVASAFWPPAAAVLLGVLAMYLVALLMAGADISSHQKDATLLPAAIVALGVMHFSWGGGFVWSLLSVGAAAHE